MSYTTMQQSAHIYLRTRASIMASRLHNANQLESLLNSEPEQLAMQIGLELSSPSALSRISPAAERAMIQTLMFELAVLLRPLQGSCRSILTYWARKFELYNLKALIRGKLMGLGYTQIRDNLFALPSIISLPHEQLLRTETISELLRQLEATPYRDIAHQARLVFEEKNEPFSLDAAIDQRYFTGLLKRAHATPSEEQRPLLRLIGSLVDQQNFSWLLRYRFNYHLTPSETLYLLIPSGVHLPFDRLRHLVKLESADQVMAEASAMFPAEIANKLTAATNLTRVEHVMALETARQAQHALRFSNSAVTCSLAYLIRREVDLRRLYAVIQGRALGLDKALIRQAATPTSGDGSDEV